MKSQLGILPGVILCAVITGLATLLEMLEARLVGEAFLEALVLAILLGVIIRTAWQPGAMWRPGIHFSAKTLLEVAVVMLGASVSAKTVAALGVPLLISIAVVVAVAIVISYTIGRLLKLPRKMALLVACGNSICGNSAIAAVAPVIGADGHDIATSIAFTAVLGVITVLVLPLLVPLLHMSLTQYGVLAGLTVYAVPQVLAATLPIGALSNQIGTVVKLVRVLMLGPVVLMISLFASKLNEPGTVVVKRKLKLQQMVPWFIGGFLVMLLLRSADLIPHLALSPIKHIASVLTTVSMAALGLGVDLRAVAKAGVRVTAAVTISLIVLGVISLGLIRLLAIA
ncbi:MAG: putative sulfate exporter family transporter [Acidocella sp.]|nr:putative sulfate exporter family transporter [Acidocella sp.]